MKEAAIVQPGSGHNLLSCRDLSVRIDGQDILQRCCLSVGNGELIALIGPNGAGKTTLLRCVAGAMDYSGSLSCSGKDIRAVSPGDRAALIGYLPQNGQIHWPMRVRDVVALGRLPFGKHAQPRNLGKDDPVTRIMRDCGVDHLSRRIANTLSGGERARVLLARAMATQASVLLADEPLASLDPRHQLSTMEALRHYASTGRSVVAVLHDIGMAIRFADRVVVMQNGRIAGTGSGKDLLQCGLLEDVFRVRLEPFFDENGRLASLALGNRS